MINSGTNPLVGRPNASPISCGGFLMAKWTESNPEETFYRSKLIDAVLLLKSLKYLKQLFVYQNQLGDMSLFTFRGVTVYACTWNRCNTWNICEQNWTKQYKLNDASGDTYGFLDLDDFGDLESSQKKKTHGVLRQETRMILGVPALFRAVPDMQKTPRDPAGCYHQNKSFPWPEISFGGFHK